MSARNRIVIATVGFLALAATARPTPITTTFTVTATDGPLAGTVAPGSFTYDSSIVVPGAQIAATGLFCSKNEHTN